MSFSQSAIFIGYSPNDYFYNNAVSSGDPYAPNDDDCAYLKNEEIKYFNDYKDLIFKY